MNYELCTTNFELGICRDVLLLQACNEPNRNPSFGPSVRLSCDACDTVALEYLRISNQSCQKPHNLNFVQTLLCDIKGLSTHVRFCICIAIYDSMHDLHTKGLSVLIILQTTHIRSNWSKIRLLTTFCRKSYTEPCSSFYAESHV
jgi:hypothetical protein